MNQKMKTAICVAILLLVCGGLLIWNYMEDNTGKYHSPFKYNTENRPSRY